MTVACKNKKEAPARQSGNQPVQVEVIIALPQPVADEVEANGTILANESAELHPEISGRITYLNVAEGKPVKKGTVIARMYNADLVANLAKSRSQLQLYEKTVERLRHLVDIGGINLADYDLAVNNVNNTRADIEYTQAQLDRTVVRAPFDGVLGLRQVSPGSYVTPSNVIATVQQLSTIKVDFTLPEEYAGIISTGNTVTVQLDETDTVRAQATVIATEPQVNVATRNLKVRAVLQQTKANPGGFAKVYIRRINGGKGYMVPTNAIIPEAKSKQLVVVKHGKAVFVNVETGDRRASTVEVVRGLQEGDSVVVTGVLFVKKDVPLKIRQVRKITDF